MIIDCPTAYQQLLKCFDQTKIDSIKTIRIMMLMKQCPEFTSIIPIRNSIMFSLEDDQIDRIMTNNETKLDTKIADEIIDNNRYIYKYTIAKKQHQEMWKKYVVH
jgi:hypothetical protein